jgi:putative nucleotidyltransferase with HDIG domain
MLHVDTPEHVHQLDEIPTDRRVALRLLWLLDDPDAPLDEITRVISADPALSARILALANASFFRDAGGVTALPRAVSLLGTNTVHSVASTAVLDLFSNRTDPPEYFWLHAITAGVAAARVAIHLDVDPSEALTAALLHDFGETLLHRRDPEQFDKMARFASAASPEAGLALETRLFGIDHATLGAQVLSSNGLPTTITDAVREHHAADATAHPLTRVVRVADCIAEIIEGDARLDLDATLRAAGISAGGDRLIEQTETDRSALLNFLADFMTPRSAIH